MYTRQQYLDNEVSHQEYYLEIATECGISWDNSPMLQEVVTCLVEGDVHLDGITLDRWDALAMQLHVLRSVSKALRVRGDAPTLSSIVCILTEAARASAQKVLDERAAYLDGLREDARYCAAALSDRQARDLNDRKPVLDLLALDPPLLRKVNDNWMRTNFGDLVLEAFNATT